MNKTITGHKGGSKSRASRWRCRMIALRRAGEFFAAAAGGT